jgi:glycosyltransferase involved in cell wall biosynthesis
MMVTTKDGCSPEKQPRLSVAVMAFDEGNSLDGFLAEMSGEMEKLGITHEILIIDDGSTDQTPDVSRSWAERNPRIRIASHPRNLGLGEVYRTGFRNCRGDYITFFPADGQFSPTIIGGYLGKILQADLVLGYTGAKKRDLLSALLSRAERILFRLLIGSLPDFQGVIMFRRSLLDRIELKSTGRGQVIMLELIAKAVRAGCAIERQEIAILPRKEGKSKVNTLRNVWANAVQLVRLRITSG